MNDTNPYKTPQITQLPLERTLDTLSDSEVKRLCVKSVTLRRFTFLFIIYSITSIALSWISDITSNYLLIPTIGLLLVCGVFTYIAAHRRPSWGRYFCFVLSAITLFLFPIGTVIGLILIVNLLGAERLFGTDKIDHRELTDENLRRKYKAQLKTKPRPNIS